MRGLFLTLALGAISIGLSCRIPVAPPSAPASDAKTAPAPEPPKEWKLVWADEFDYTGLPDPEKWEFEEGMLRNNEEQCYTRNRKENAWVEGGVLTITGRKERFANPRYKPGGRRPEFAEYTSASLRTRDRKSWQYGRIEMRAKLPQGRGVWPAFWTLGAEGRWPSAGEIDIMEFVGHTPDSIHATLHWQGGGRHQSLGGRKTVDRPWDDFHVYAVEWDTEHMNFFYDREQFYHYDVLIADDKGYNGFRRPHFILLNLALGGQWGGEIDDSIFPQTYVVDYVRVYQEAEKK